MVEQPIIRSGDQVLSTAGRMGMVMALLAPFIAGGVRWMQAHLQYTDLGGEAYVDTVKAALAVYLPLAVARVHMIWIRRAASRQAEDDRLQALVARWPLVGQATTTESQPPAV